MKLRSSKKRKWVFVAIIVLVGAAVAAALYFANRTKVDDGTIVPDSVVEIAKAITEEEIVEEEIEPEEVIEEGGGWSEYYIKVNRKQNVVMVYVPDDDGEFTKLIRTFVSSVGREDSETPLGVFNILSRYEALYLVGNVWGHYATQISGPYYFHSVPYYSKGDPYWDDLEYLEYNKLGEGASAGCVRLAASDAEWIYVNIPYGTTVEIYDSDELPEGVVKPTPIRIDENDIRRGWDPTDPDPANPWRV